MAGQHGRGQRLQLLRSSSSMTEASEAVKGCKIKEMSSTAKGMKGYKMDEVISIMAACSHSVCMLKQKAAPTKCQEKTTSSESCGLFLQLVLTVSDSS